MKESVCVCVSYLSVSVWTGLLLTGVCCYGDGRPVLGVELSYLSAAALLILLRDAQHGTNSVEG